MSDKWKYIVIIIGAVFFNFLFWEESLGANLVLFTCFLIIAAKLVGYVFFSSKPKVVVFTGLFLLTGAVFYHSSVFACSMYFISLTFLAGLIHAQKLQSLMFVMASSAASIVYLPAEFFKRIPIKKRNKKRLSHISKWLRLSVIPIALLFVFYLIYSGANPVFDNYSFRFLRHIGNFFVNLFESFSFARFLFFLFGIFFTAWFVLKTDLGYLLKQEAAKSVKLYRKRVKRIFSKPENSKVIVDNMPVLNNKKFALSLKLKYEYLSAAILLVLINVLLLVVNFIDISWVWFGFEYEQSFDLKQFVHEGTYLLIISVLLSMAIMLYFFRRNLNFYSKSGLIKKMSYAWIIQNFILVLSVLIRNYHYIHYFGLAYKRIGVIIFLVAVVFGLLTLYLKIKDTKSTYYLFKTNSLFIYVLLVFSSLFDWDAIITTHNINHPIRNNMETSYILCMSDKTLPLIEQNKQILEQETQYNTYKAFDVSYEEFYKSRVDEFILRYEKESWKSWNYKEWIAYKYYKK